MVSKMRRLCYKNNFTQKRSKGYRRYITLEEKNMVFHPMISYVVSLVAGILILIFPETLNYIVAFYLIIIGLAGILGTRA